MVNLSDLVDFALTVTLLYKETPLSHEAFETGHCLPSSNQHEANSVTVAPWHTKSVPRMPIAWKASFLESFLAVSALILNGSSIE